MTREQAIAYLLEQATAINTGRGLVELRSAAPERTTEALTVLGAQRDEIVAAIRKVRTP
jgi:hypothetical protein